MVAQVQEAAVTLFSVVVPAYNAEMTLGETLEAIAAQTLPDWQCVVIDDGSNDRTLELARSFEFADSRFVVATQANRGTGGAYNAGVRTASGEWIVICSADDLLLPDHLLGLAERLRENPGFDIYSCNGLLRLEDGTEKLRYSGPEAQRPTSWSLEDLLVGCFFSVGACYRRDLFDATGGYREGIYGEDYDFWLRAMLAGAKHLYTPQVTVVHRVSRTQKSADHGRTFASDIRSITSLMESGGLSRREERVALAAIRRRQRLMAGLGRQATFLERARRRIRRLADRRGFE